MLTNLSEVKSNVLIVDDIKTNICLLEKTLESLDVNIDTAQSGDEALQHLVEKDYALVILDVQMPEMDGYEVARHIRQNEDTRNTPIIFMTAINKSHDNIIEGYDVGAVDYLFKPVEPDILRRKAQIFIDLYSADRKLKRSKQDLEAALEEVADAVIMIDRNCMIQYSNSAACKFFEFVMNEDIDTSLFDTLFFTDPKSGSDYKAIIEAAILNRERVEFVDKVRIGNKQNKHYTVKLSTVPLLDVDEQYMGIVFNIQDDTMSELLAERLHYSANHDPLTTLPNRHCINTVLETVIKDYTDQERQFALFSLDLDNFKQVNDSLGHKIGDELLKTVAKRLQNYADSRQNIARVGGDEFILVQDTIYTASDIARTANNILSEFEQPFKIQEHELFLGCSIGISVFPDDGNDVQTLVQNADAALGTVKHEGKNAYRFFEVSLQESAEEGLKISTELRRAIIDQQLEVYFQPQYDVNGARCIGFEALIRWFGDDGKVTPPNKFIPIAERCGLIKSIDSFVLRESCKALRHWQDELDIDDDCRISVNISLIGFYDKNLPIDIRKLLTEYALKPSQLEIEITESVFIEDKEKFLATLDELKNIGVRIAIDDFGTGYSNLSYLKTLPVDVLKIDQVFIQNLLHSKKDQAIVQAVLELGKLLEMDIVAEGVEEEAQLAFLKEKGCDVIQGYWYARPMTSSAVEAFLKG